MKKTLIIVVTSALVVIGGGAAVALTNSPTESELTHQEPVNYNDTPEIMGTMTGGVDNCVITYSMSNKVIEVSSVVCQNEISTDILSLSLEDQAKAVYPQYDETVQELIRSQG